MTPAPWQYGIIIAAFILGLGIGTPFGLGIGCVISATRVTRYRRALSALFSASMAYNECD